MSIGLRREVRISEVLFRDGHDPFEPKWAIAVEDNGTSHLLYGVRHGVAPRAGMRAVMEFGANERWVLVAEVQP